MRFSHQLRVGPVTFRIGSDWRAPIAALRALYRDYPAPEDGIADFTVRLSAPRPWRRWLRPAVTIGGDYWLADTAPLPIAQALLAAEMGMNLQMALGQRRFLLLHAGVVARDGRALILTGESGAGKSTLAALLGERGWRLLGDEFALLDPADGRLWPFPRPVSLKNAAIDLLAAQVPAARWGPRLEGTPKGTIRHLVPNAAALAAMEEPVVPAAILFPRFGEAPAARPVSPGEAFVRLTQASTNYVALGERGFEALTRLVESCPGTAIDYPDTATAIAQVEAVFSADQSSFPGEGRGPRAPSRAGLGATSDRPAAGPRPSPGKGHVENVTSNAMETFPVLPFQGRSLNGAPDARLLAAALRDPTATAALSGADWTALIAMARAEQLIGTLAYRLAGLELPPRIAALLADARASAEQQRTAALWEAEMARRALAPLGVPVVLLKGTAFVAAGLKAGVVRSIGDLDILVPHAALDAVEAALLAAGWEWVKPDPYDDAYYRRWMHELPPLIHRARDRMIDVHHTILPLTAARTPDAEALLADSIALAEGLRMLNPADMICHAAAHLLADGDLAGGLRNLWDIHCLIEEFGTAGLAERAAWHDLALPVARALRLTRDLFGTETGETHRAPPFFVHRLTARDGWGRPTRRLTRFGFYLRSHLLRMPPLMLARHLLIKARR